MCNVLIHIHRDKNCCKVCELGVLLRRRHIAYNKKCLLLIWTAHESCLTIPFWIKLRGNWGVAALPPSPYTHHLHSRFNNLIPVLKDISIVYTLYLTLKQL